MNSSSARHQIALKQGSIPKPCYSRKDFDTLFLENASRFNHENYFRKASKYILVLMVRWKLIEFFALNMSAHFTHRTLPKQF